MRQRMILAIWWSALGLGCGTDPTTAVDARSTPAFCELLPEMQPCSLACDLERLGREYVPDGTCVLFACTLTNGEPLKLHVCNPAGD